MAAGRPKTDLNYQTIEKLATIMCTQEEIASYLGVCRETLQRDEEFCRIYKAGLDKGRMSLRRMQYRTAETGSATMQIWLGKQYLWQKDNMDLAHSGKIESELRVLTVEQLLKLAGEDGAEG